MTSLDCSLFTQLYEQQQTLSCEIFKQIEDLEDPTEFAVTLETATKEETEQWVDELNCFNTRLWSVSSMCSSITTSDEKTLRKKLEENLSLAEEANAQHGGTNPPSSGLSGGAIAGIVIGVVVFVLIVIAIAWLYYDGGKVGRRRRRRRKGSSGDDEIELADLKV